MILALLTHGEWGEVLLKSTELITGRIKDVVCFPLAPDQSFKEYLNEIQKFVNEHMDHEILFIADVAGGSTFNAAGVLSTKNNQQAVCGLSMEMLIQADELRQEYSGHEMVRQLIDISKNKIINIRLLVGKG